MMPVRWVPKNSYARWSLVLQLLLVFSTVAYTCTSNRQLGVMERSLEASEAAELIVENTAVPSEIVADVASTFTIRILNKGKRTAKVASPIGFQYGLAPGGTSAFDFKAPLVKDLRGVRIPAAKDWDFPINVPPLNEPVVRDIEEARSVLYLYGWVAYWNGFRAATTPFCHRWIPPSRRGGRHESGTEPKSEQRLGGCEFPPPPIPKYELAVAFDRARQQGLLDED